MSHPLAGLRLAVTMPPPSWFGGVDYDFAVELGAELRAMGAAVFEVETGGFVARNPVHVERSLAALRSFGPDVAVSLPNASYLLLCRTPSGENVFRDILEIPSIMLWDHGLFQFPKTCLDPMPGRPEDAQTGAIARLRGAMNHPLYHHYSPDRGHVETLARLGVIDAKRVRLFLQPAYPNFVSYGRRPPTAGAFRTRVAFAGNVYLRAASALPYRDRPELQAIEEQALTAKTADLTAPMWNLLVDRLGELSPKRRRQLGLVPDSTFFWSFLYDEVEVVGNTHVRLHVLSKLARACDFYGNFVEPGAASALRARHGLHVHRSLDYFTELPLLFMNSDVIVDVVNLGYNTGVSPKVMGVFACGGLVLFDHKADFAAALGDLASQVMYRTVDELNALVDRYLTDRTLRLEVSRGLQSQVSTRFSFSRLARRVLVEEPHWRA